MRDFHLGTGPTVRYVPCHKEYSLEKKLGNSEFTLGDSMSDPLSTRRIEAPSEYREMKKILDALLRKLDRREEYIMRRRSGFFPQSDPKCGYEATLRELGSELDLSRERVRQLENKAKRNLREMMSSCEEGRELMLYHADL